jgi:hypothetical protein
MPIDFLTDRVDFQAASGQLEAPHQVLSFTFSAKVIRATAMLSGFNFDFPKTDRPIHQVYVDLIAREPTGETGQQVDVEVFAFFRDFSGQADDLWEASAHVTVIAETE